MLFKPEKAQTYSTRVGFLWQTDSSKGGRISEDDPCQINSRCLLQVSALLSTQAAEMLFV